jgi:uncharacterized membrane protein
VTETAAERHTSSTGRWLYQRRLRIALGIAVLEGILVALEKDFTRWTLIIISAPIIAFYLFAGRSLESDTGRQLAWIAAAAQAFAVILTIVALVIGAFVLIIAGVFAAIALILLFGERDRPKQT